jgi:TolB-like protein/Tfp pilus assembly protein PilF
MMLTDVVGYSALTQRDERQALELLGEQERIVRPILGSHRGRTVKSLGDGFLVEFSSALDAVRCAIEIQRALERWNSGSPDRRLELRIGVHLGDVVHQRRDVFGDAVNIVARIEPLADPGGVCVSQQVYDQVRNKLDTPFASAGAPRMKNIDVPIRIYKIALPSAHPAPVPRVERPRVAVLPLANISGRDEDEYFADGITEELIQTLSKIGGLRVIARTSMMRYKHADKSPSEIARELGATAVVEGSIRKAGPRIRVTTRLLDASSAETLWSQEYDREVRDVFALQSDVSRRIAKALEVEILGPEQSVLGRAITADAEAHAFYLEGRYFLNQRTDDSLRQALANFERALQKDSRLAPAYAGIADAYSTLAWLEFLRPRYAFPRARAAALKATALDATLAEAHASLGFVRFLYDRAWVEAEREFRHAIALNQNYPTAHQFYSDFLKAMGRLDEALSEIQRALELDPLSLGINTALGHVLYLSRQYDRAIEQYRKALELDPNFAQAHLWFGRPYLERGMYDEAIDELQTAVRLSKDSTMSLAVLGHAYASAGRLPEAKELLARLMKRSRAQYVPSYWIALIHTGLKDRDRAFAWLERANRERSAWLAWIKVEPRFDGLRSDPRFARLLRRLRLS